jgi:hypothetical protein
MQHIIEHLIIECVIAHIVQHCHHFHHLEEVKNVPVILNWELFFTKEMQACLSDL